MPIPVFSVEAKVSPSNSAMKKNVMMNMFNHRISVLKRISQDAYNAFINLQLAKQMCKEAIGWLDQIFQQWGPYMQFFDRLIPLIAKNLDLPGKVITIKEGIDNIKDLL